MHTKFRTALLWLLFLLLPLQGFATSAMLFCKSMHHPEITMQTSNPNACDHIEHQHIQHAQHALSDTNSDHSPHHQSHNDTTNCSACTSCCVGTALILSFDRTVSSVSPGPHSIAFLTIHFVGHIPAGPERPPRQTLV